MIHIGDDNEGDEVTQPAKPSVSTELISDAEVSSVNQEAETLHQIDNQESSR